MNPVHRFRAWCAKPYVEAIAQQIAQQVFEQAYASGERDGIDQTIRGINDMIEERNGRFVEPEDVERLRRRTWQ